MKIGVVGNGVVGHATARSYTEFHEVRVHDLRPERSTHTLDEVLDCDLIFVCLPTPQLRDGLACDLSVINAFFSSVPNDRNYVLRSTVPIGTTRLLRLQYGIESLCHSPEFLTARCAVADAMLPSRNIIGGHFCDASTLLAELYEKRFPGIPLLLMSSDDSEAVKLFLNAFFAIKVSAFNEFRRLADAAGLHWNVVRDGMLSDGRLTPNHTQVPGHDGKWGWGGECLPKDTASLLHTMLVQGTPCSTLHGARKTNRKVRSDA